MARYQRLDRALIMGARYLLTRSGAGAGPFWSSLLFHALRDPEMPELEVFFTPMAVREEFGDKGWTIQNLMSLGKSVIARGKTAAPGIQIDINLLAPSQRRPCPSRQRRIRWTRRLIDPQFFRDPADLADLVAGVRHMREVLRQPALQGVAGPELSPGTDALKATTRSPRPSATWPPPVTILSAAAAWAQHTMRPGAVLDAELAGARRRGSARRRLRRLSGSDQRQHQRAGYHAGGKSGGHDQGQASPCPPKIPKDPKKGRQRHDHLRRSDHAPLGALWRHHALRHSGRATPWTCAAASAAVATIVEAIRHVADPQRAGRRLHGRRLGPRHRRGRRRPGDLRPRRHQRRHRAWGNATPTACPCC